MINLKKTLNGTSEGGRKSSEPIGQVRMCDILAGYLTVPWGILIGRERPNRKPRYCGSQGASGGIRHPEGLLGRLLRINDVVVVGNQGLSDCELTNALSCIVNS